METNRRVSRFSHLLEARHELRQYLVLETALIESISRLPEEDFCQNAREAMSLGAGYAYLHRDQACVEDQWIHVFSAFFALQPTNKYLDPEVVRQQQDAIIKAALDRLGANEPPEIDPAINAYTVTELEAFVEGFMLARDFFAEEPVVEQVVA